MAPLRSSTDSEPELEPEYRDRVPLHKDRIPFIGRAPKVLAGLGEDYEKSSLRISRALERTILLALLLLSVLIGFANRHSGTPVSSSLPASNAPQPQDAPSNTSHIGSTVALAEVPHNTKIVGLVFFGRPLYVDILDCYLRRNLVVNGGVLAEIRFILHTSKADDIAWLENLVEVGNLQDHYKLLYEDKELGRVWANGGEFSYMWGKYATDDDTIYVKIDDDMVYLEDTAIPRMVNSLIAHPEAYSIQANTVNSRFTHWFHHTTGAILPFLPDPQPTQSDTSRKLSTWRTSDLPGYPMSSLPPGGGPVLEVKADPKTSSPRWLPLPATAKNLLRTPFEDGSHLPDPRTGNVIRPPRWPVAAQEHYSFFHNLEHGKLSSYAFGSATDGLFNTWFHHYNINFMAFWGKTMKARPFWDEDEPGFLPNDEYALTIDLPRELGMPVLVDSRALVVHYSFHFDQREGLYHTDILERYRLLANDLACSKENQKSQFVPF